MLSVTVSGMTFPSPLLNASGAFQASVFSQLFELSDILGGIVTKTVTAEPWAGNPQSRTVELPGIGMLNSIGLQNPGLAHTLNEEVPALKQYLLPVILSLSAGSSSAFGEMARRITEHPHGGCVDALEINLSCPNIETGGVHFGVNPQSVREAIRAIVGEWSKPVFAKLTPNVTDIIPLADAALEGGAQGLTAINTVLGVAINVHQRKPYLPRVSGGYSGPGIKPIALHAVWQLHQHFPHVPIMASGGMMNAVDVLEFLMAGASLVQIGTACFRDPLVFPRIYQDLQDYVEKESLTRLSDIVGCAHQRHETGITRGT